MGPPYSGSVLILNEYEVVLSLLRSRFHTSFPSTVFTKHGLLSHFGAKTAAYLDKSLS